MNADDRARLNRAMTALADGDRREFDTVFEMLWPVLRDLCARVLPSHEAEDAAQQALLKVFDQAPLFDRDRDAFTWAATIAHWEIRTLRQRRRRSKETPATPDDRGGLAHADTGATPEQMLSERQWLEAVQATLGALTDPDRQTLLEAFHADHATTTPAFRKRKQRALERLRALFWRLHDDRE
jgi:RNA polymerase sigma-70 factor (ECF subfamily)